ncbi:MAG: patatin-like phospholipase family protein [Trichloromonadaceae bacterium]
MPPFKGFRLLSLLLALLSLPLLLAGCLSGGLLPSSRDPGPAVVVPAPPTPAVRPARVAVVLGAGASRGFAHIGVLKILEGSNVPIHMVVGTSAGSFVGSLYAYGYSAFDLQKLALGIKKSDIVDMTLPDNGFVRGDKLEAYVNDSLKNTPLDKLKIPFFAVATNIQTGKEVVFSRGNAGQAVRSSCSIPGVFRPVQIGDAMYVDGGVVSPVGVDAARAKGADLVIAVDISADFDTRRPVGTVDTILQSVNIMYAQISAQQLTRADVVIRPRVGHIGSAAFEQRHEAILEGEKATLEVLPQIQAALEKLRQEGRL